jgi:hypothetical protein
MTRRCRRSPPAGLLALLAAAPALGGCIVAQPVPVYGYAYPVPVAVGTNAAAGAALGAAAGGLLGAAAADPWNRGGAALGGAAAGALLGGMVGAAADAQTSAYALPPPEPVYPPPYRY